jgi:hypothetical protein
MSLKCARALKLDRYSPDVAPYRNEPTTNGRTTISGQHVVEWLHTDPWTAAYQEDTPTALQYTFVGDAIGSGSDFATVDMLVPNVRLLGDSPSVAGVEMLTQTVPWEARDDLTSNILQVTYWTLDSA